jgi:hypothetical protein
MASHFRIVLDRDELLPLLSVGALYWKRHDWSNYLLDDGTVGLYEDYLKEWDKRTMWDAYVLVEE